MELPAVFYLSGRFAADADVNKVNLTIGAYRTEAGKPWVLPCVRQVYIFPINPSLFVSYKTVLFAPGAIYSQYETRVYIIYVAPAMV